MKYFNLLRMLRPKVSFKESFYTANITDREFMFTEFKPSLEG